MIQVSIHRSRAELRNQALFGAEWHRYEDLVSTLGAAWDEDRKARSIAVDLLPFALSKIREQHLGAIVCDQDVSPALRARAARFLPDVRGLDPRLAPYQQIGVAYLRSRFAALIGDDMGLGKTAQLLQALHSPRATRVLVVCPAVAKAVWRYEASLWAPGLKVSILDGKRSFRWPQIGEAVVVNYDILPRGVIPEPPEGVVMMLDEIHYCKGRSLRQKSARMLVRAVRRAGGRAWGATGTPLDNKPPDLYRIAETLGLEREFGSWQNFVRMFGGFKLPFGMAWGKPKPGCKDILERLMLRRKKIDVLNLPPVRYSTRPVQLSLRDTHAIDLEIAASGIRVQDITEAAIMHLAQNPHLMTARRLLAQAKLAAALEWIAECEEAGEPAVVFSAHRAPVDAIGKRPGWRVITGETSHADRATIAKAMQEGKLKGIAGTIRAMGVAITLTRPAMCCFIDQEWTPGTNQQARDRLVRIGQNRSVTVYHLVASHEVDERVTAILAEKAERQLLTVDAITGTPDSARADAMLRLADDLDLEHI